MRRRRVLTTGGATSRSNLSKSSPDHLYSTLTSSAYSTLTASVYSTFTSSAAFAFVVYQPGARHGLGRHLCCQRLVLVAAENRAERHAVCHVANYQKREGGGKEQ